MQYKWDVDKFCFLKATDNLENKSWVHQQMKKNLYFVKEPEHVFLEI